MEEGKHIPKPDLARILAGELQEPEEEYIRWSQERTPSPIPGGRPTPRPRYPEAREALIELCEDQETARSLFSGTSIGPLEAALYGLLVERMSQQIGDLGFWGFLPPRDQTPPASDGRLLLEAFFEMLTHPEGEKADYKKVFSTLITSWSYGPGPHRISVMHPDQTKLHYRLALVTQEGSIIPALEPEDPFHALYRMLSPRQRGEIAEVCRVLLRHDQRIEIQAALAALSRWHRLP